MTEQQKNNTKTDEQLFQDFIKEYGVVKRLSERSLHKYHYATKPLLDKIKELGYTTQTLDKDGALSLYKWLLHCNLAEQTRKSYWDRFTRFYKWVSKTTQKYDKEAHNLLVGEEKILYQVNKNNEEEKPILQHEDFLHLIQYARSPEYKVFFAVLYDTGARIDEALSLQYRDVKENKDGELIINIRKSKTDKRSIPIRNTDLFLSYNYLRRWLKEHPHKHNPETPLFTNMIGEKLEYAVARKFLKQALKRAGLKTKGFTFHCFRHSRASFLVDHLKPYQMCDFFGWTYSSNMPSHYAKKNSTDIRRALMQAGGETEETKRPVGKRCIQCDHINTLEATDCDMCNLPLDAEQVRKLKENVDIMRVVKEYIRKEFGDVIQQVRSEVPK